MSTINSDDYIVVSERITIYAHFDVPDAELPATNTPALLSGRSKCPITFSAIAQTTAREITAHIERTFKMGAGTVCLLYKDCVVSPDTPLDDIALNDTPSELRKSPWVAFDAYELRWSMAPYQRGKKMHVRPSKLLAMQGAAEKESGCCVIL